MMLRLARYLRNSLCIVAIGLGSFAEADVQVVDAYQGNATTIATEDMTIEQRLARIEQQLGAQQQLEVLQRVDALQQQVQELQGQVEVQQHQLDQLKQQIAQPTNYGANPATNTDVIAAPSHVVSGNALTEKPAISQPQTTAANKAAVAPAQDSADFTGDPQADYQAVYSLLEQQNYAGAREGFANYLTRYPNSSYRANAYYWLGELQLKQREYPQALVSFEHVTKDYPNNSKVADALLKQGYIHHELGELREARALLQQVQQRYPESSSARLAQQRLQQMHSQGL